MSEQEFGKKETLKYLEERHEKFMSIPWQDSPRDIKMKRLIVEYDLMKKEKTRCPEMDRDAILCLATELSDLIKCVNFLDDQLTEIYNKD